MDKSVYTLRELVEEIYETNELQDETFESNYKDLQRLDEYFRSLSDFSKIKGIPKENKDQYVKFMKNLINNDEMKKLLRKLSKEKNSDTSNKKSKMKSDEYDKFMEFMVDTTIENQEELGMKIDKNNQLIKRIEDTNCRLIDLLKIVVKYFDEQAFFLTEEVFNECSSDMDKIIDKYENDVNELFEKTKKRCNELDELDDAIYINKMMETLSASVQSKKYNDKYNKELKKYKATK